MRIYKFLPQGLKLNLAVFGILSVLLFLHSNLYAQDISHEIKGRVTSGSDDEPLIGVSVNLKGTNISTVTNDAGLFSLKSNNASGVLVFSYVGYETKEESISGRTTINVRLKSMATTLDQVVVIGFGQKEQREVVSSISTINADQIDNRPVTNAFQAMTGQVPGLTISVSNGGPGDLPTINLRGIGSITAGSEPLFVIDDFPTTQRNFESLDPSDIASISVLKDASATAIYGSRGSNGVIIVTTKKGKTGKPKISIRADGGVSYVPRSSRMEVLNAKEFVQYYTEFYTNQGAPVPNAIKNYDGTVDTDWQDEIYKVAPFQKYHISASGGTSDFDYYLSAGFTENDNVIMESWQKKSSFRVKGRYHPGKIISFGMNLAANFNNFKKSSDIGPTNFHGNAGYLAVLAPPIAPVKDDDGNYTDIRKYLGWGQAYANPVELINNYSDKTDLFRSINEIDVAITPVRGLTIKSMFGVDFGSDRGKVVYVSPGPRNGLASQSTLSLNQGQRISWLSQNTFDYKWTLSENHKFSVLGGVTYQSENAQGIRVGISDFGVMPPTSIGFGNISNLSGSNSFSGNNLISYLGRLDYGYKGKYLISASGRRDGSSRFGSNNRFSNFGSIALGWRLSEEAFLKESDLISDLKLRLSYGLTGNNQIGDFSARSTLNTTDVTIGNSLLKGVESGTPGSPQLTWEKANEYNIGLDFSLLDYRINASVDLYNRETSSLLLSKDLPASTGFTSILTNIGKMSNRGIEVSLNASPIRSNNVEWSIGGNFAMDEEKVLDINDAPFINMFSQVIMHVKGKSLYQIQSVRALGILMPGETPPKAQPNAKPGDVIFEDVNGDGSISSFQGPDGVLLGSSHPKITYGFNTNFRYKQLNLSMLFQGQAGGVVQDFGLIQVGTPFQSANMSKEFWYTGRYIDDTNTGDGKTPKPGRFLASAAGAGTVSSMGIQSTKFLRLTNLTLSYNLPEQVYKKLGLGKMQVYSSLENLFTITPYIESNNPDKMVAGIQSLTGILTQPIPTIWTFGINVSF